MSYDQFRILGLLVALTGLSGCRVHVGANHLFLVTRMNSGFDADTLPPVVELSLFSRFDGVHVPSFEDAQTVPVVTSFRRGGYALWSDRRAIRRRYRVLRRVSPLGSLWKLR